MKLAWSNRSNPYNPYPYTDSLNIDELDAILQSRTRLLSPHNPQIHHRQPETPVQLHDRLVHVFNRQIDDWEDFYRNDPYTEYPLTKSLNELSHQIDWLAHAIRQRKALEERLQRIIKNPQSDFIDYIREKRRRDITEEDLPRPPPKKARVEVKRPDLDPDFDPNDWCFDQTLQIWHQSQGPSRNTSIYTLITTTPVESIGTDDELPELSPSSLTPTQTQKLTNNSL